MKEPADEGPSWEERDRETTACTLKEETSPSPQGEGCMSRGTAANQIHQHVAFGSSGGTQSAPAPRWPLRMLNWMSHVGLKAWVRVGPEDCPKKTAKVRLAEATPADSLRPDQGESLPHSSLGCTPISI